MNFSWEKFLLICLIGLFGIADVLAHSGLSPIDCSFDDADTLYVDESCTALLEWNESEINCEATNPGGVIVSRTLESVSGGYEAGDSVSAGTTVTITYRVRDNMGNTEFFSFDIEFVDTLPPVFDPQTLPPDTALINSHDYPPATVSASDNCDPEGDNIVIEVVDEAIPNICDGGVWTRTYIATDAFGNQTEYVQFITQIPDTIPPVFVVGPADTSVYCDQMPEAYESWLAAQYDWMEVINASGGALVISDDAPLPEDMTGFCGDLEVTFTALDSCGNQQSESALFSLTDTVPPQLITPAMPLALDCTSPDALELLTNWIDSIGFAEIEEDCGPLTVGFSPQPGSPEWICNDSMEVEWQLEDACGNTTVVHSILFIQDTLPPELISEAEDMVVDCAASDLGALFLDWLEGGAGAVPADGCTSVEDLELQYLYQGQPMNPSQLWDIFSDGLQAGCTDSILSGGNYVYHVLSHIEIGFEFTDFCGHSTVSYAQFLATDDQAPVISVQPESYTMQCASDSLVQQSLIAWYESAGGMEADDNCSEWMSGAAFTPEELWNLYLNSRDTLCGNTGRVSVLFYAEDACQNRLAAESEVFFYTIDTLSPQLVAPPSSLLIHCDSDPLQQLENWIKAYGNAQIGEVCSELSPGVFDWTTSSGQTGSGSVEEGPYPELELETCGQQWEFEFSVEDACGNTLSFSAMVEMEDLSPPSFTGTQDTVWLDCDEDIEQLFVLISDGCSEFDVQYSDSIIAHSYQGCGDFEQVLERVYEATDVCGNVSDFHQILVRSDFSPPEFQLPPNQVISCELFGDPGPDDYPSEITDNCFSESEIEISYEDEFINYGCAGGVNRTWTATDPCGNTYSAIQFFELIDSNAPVILQPPLDLVLECGDSGKETALEEWLDAAGNAEVEDACSSVLFFAALPGSYVLGDSTTYPGTRPTIPDIPPCDSISGEILSELQLDFVFIDECGNSVVEKASLILTDSSPPEILNCPEEMVVHTETGQCEGQFFRPDISVYDACGLTTETIIRVDSATIESANSADPNEVVLPLELVFPDLFDPFRPLQSLSLEIELMGVDGEQPTEVFLIYDPLGQLIGQTVNTDEQCGYSSTRIDINDPQELAQWLDNGSMAFQLVPLESDSLPGSFYINDICDPGLVVGTLTAQRSDQQDLNFSFRIGYEEEIDWADFSEEGIALSAGNHPVLLSAEDCSGNRSHCEFVVQVIPEAGPEVECSENSIGYTGMDDCIFTHTPKAVDYQHACIEQGAFFYSHGPGEFEWLTFSLHPDWNEFQMEDVHFYFSGLPPSAGGEISLFLEYQGDVDTAFAYMELLSADGTLIGNTLDMNDEIVRQGSCEQSGLVRFELVDSLYNQLKEGDELHLVLRQNTQIPFDPNQSGLAINPCSAEVTENGDSDGVSFVRAFLKIHSVKVDIHLTHPDGTEKDTSYYLGGEVPELDFPGGLNTLTYWVYDPWGNADSCSYTLEVIDTIPPVAICQNSIVTLNPSVLDTFIIERQVVDGASFDNCEITAYEISPNSFNCLDIGTEQEVQLTVFDAHGNADSCTSIVRLESIALNPDFTLDLCNPDSLFLFAMAPGDESLYSYEWAGPLGFTSSELNPIIPGVGPANSGNYQLTITGFGGCSATGSVNVSINTIATPTLSAASKVVCEGDQIELQAPAYTGQISYKWYSGNPPSGVLLGTTSQPNFNILLPRGSHSFYVVVENPQCASNPSATLNVEVVEEPHAEIDPVFVRVCEGEPLSLSSPLGSAFDYHWSGPANFVSDLQNPLVTLSASSIHQGTYSLVVELGSCISEEIEAEVVVDPSPAKPIVQGSSAICEGDSISLRVSNIPIATRYRWVFPDGSETITSINQLFISGASTDLAGEWQVQVDFGQCRSELSNPFFISIDEIPDPTLFNSSPVCEGDTVILASSPIEGANYEWSGPGGFSFSGDSIQQPLSDGNYELTVVTPAGCTQTSSTTVVNKIRPEIQAIISQGFECADGNTDYCFQVVVFPADDGSYNYEWTGPNDFISSQASGCIPNSTESDNGVYGLVVSADGCASDSEEIEVQVTDIGFEPQILTSVLSYCEGDTIVLESDVEAKSGRVFNWVTPSGIATSSEPRITFSPADMGMAGTYSLFVSIDQCTTASATPVEIEVRPRPNIPVLQGGGSFCEGDSIVLQVDPVMGELYFWEGPVSFEQGMWEQVLWPAEKEMEGDYRVLAVANGCPSEPSPFKSVAIRPKPDTPNPIVPSDGICLDDEPFLLELCIEQDSLVGGTVLSYFLNEELDDPVVSGFSHCKKFTDPSVFEPGSNSLIARAELNGCYSDFSTVKELRAYEIPDEEAYAGDDFLSCEADEVFLLADAPETGIGRWSSLRPELVFEDVENAMSRVSNLSPGVNVLIWSLSNGSCRNYDRDTVELIYLDHPIARDLVIELPMGGQVDIELTENDYLPDSVALSILSSEGVGVIELREPDLLSYMANERRAGEFVLRYKICLITCPEKCDEAEVRIIAGDESDCTPPNIFTPNGDGINDAFIVPCLSESRYLNNSLKVFDQWGSLVFRAAPYDNNWEGTHRGEPLPEGTYFYVLDFGDGSEAESGYVIIKR